MIELIIVMALSLVVLGVIYAFFSINQKSLARAEINSTLQGEAATIQKEIGVIGTQGKEITSMIDYSTGSTVNPSSVNYTVVDSTIENGILKGYRINSLTTQICYTATTGTYTTANYTLYLVDNSPKTEKKLYLKNSSDAGDGKLLSDNVVSMSVTPLNYQEVATKSAETFDKTTGVQINIILHIKKGFSDITYPVTTVVNFRNRDLNP